MFLNMGFGLNTKSERLAYSLSVAYDLLKLLESPQDLEAIKNLVGLGSGCYPLGHRWIREQPRYTEAVWTLEREFGRIESVRTVLDDIYEKCPTLKPRQNKKSKEK